MEEVGVFPEEFRGAVAKQKLLLVVLRLVQEVVRVGLDPVHSYREDPCLWCLPVAGVLAKVSPILRSLFFLQ